MAAGPAPPQRGESPGMDPALRNEERGSVPTVPIRFDQPALASPRPSDQAMTAPARSQPINCSTSTAIASAVGKRSQFH